jgi:Rho family protein
VECFLALLEYMYTDHSPIQENDSVGIMVLADEYGQSRLIDICELYIRREVDRSTSKQIKKGEIDVIGLLLTAQVNIPIIKCHNVIYLKHTFIDISKRFV